MTFVRSILTECMPPVITRGLQKWRSGGNRFKGDFPSWEAALARCTGYDAEHILAKVLEATLKVRRGEMAFERDSVVFDEIEYAWPVTAGLMWAAARNGGKLNVLDFGGALGSSYFQNRKWLQSLPEVQWNVVEQAHFVESGQLHIQDAQLRFYKTIKECLAEKTPNVVLLSSVLQYLQSPDATLEELSNAGATCLIVDRTPITPLGKDRILLQHVPPSIYMASYPMRVFSKQNLLNRLSENWCLIASHMCPEASVRSEENFEFSFQGFILDAC